MLLKCILATAALLASSASAAMAVDADRCTPVTADEVKVMSFNVRTSNAPDPCPSGCWDQRKSRVERMLASYTPDFIGTQETAVAQTNFFADTLKSYAATGECAGNCWDNERNSILYNTDKWMLYKTQTFALSDTPEVLGSNSWGLEYLRAAVLARFQSKKTGNWLCMLNTHYDITKGQDQSSMLVARRMADFCQATDAVVMTGDLNTLPNTSPILYLEGKTTQGNEKTPMELYEMLTTAGVGNFTWIGSSFSIQPIEKKIDYIFARRDPQTCVQGGKIITDSYDGYTTSDHAPVMSNFCIGIGCTSCL